VWDRVLKIDPPLEPRDHPYELTTTRGLCELCECTSSAEHPSGAPTHSPPFPGERLESATAALQPTSHTQRGCSAPMPQQTRGAIPTARLLNVRGSSSWAHKVVAWTYRSISPKTTSRVPMMVTTSASMCPSDSVLRPARCGTPGARMWHLYGLFEPSDTM